MSGTINTMPYEVQKRKREFWRTIVHFYPGPYGGAWPGRSKAAQFRNRQHRRACRLAIVHQRELPVEVRRVAYDIW